MSELNIWQNGQYHVQSFSGTPVLDEVLQAAGQSLPHPCGGRGRCGKCAVTLSGAVSPPNEAERRAGQRLSCQAVLLGNASVVLPDTVKVYDLHTGECIGTAAGLNPQGTVAADVMGRIDAAMHGALPRLKEQVRGAVRALLSSWGATHGLTSIMWTGCSFVTTCENRM